MNSRIFNDSGPMDSLTINLSPSNLPYSVERAVGVTRQALKLFPDLKRRFLNGTPEEKEQVKSAGLALMERIDDEFRKTTEILGLPPRSCEILVSDHLSLQEKALYQEATQFIKQHCNEIFSVVKSANKVFRKTKLRILC